ncbi:transglycosylase family protein [Kitasatospora sp. NPDC094028]
MPPTARPRRLLPAALCALAVALAAPAAHAAPPGSDGTGPGGGPYDWEGVAACESSGNWHVNSGNGYFGGLQFDNPTWREHGGLAFAPRADLASREEQITVAQRLAGQRGLSPWPVCGARATRDHGRGPAPAPPGPQAAKKPTKQPANRPTKQPANRPTNRPTDQPADQPADTAGQWTVREDDTLTDLAAALRVPGGWPALYALNRTAVGEDPDLIHPGLVLRLPS